MNISLPDSMRTYIEAQVAQGGFSTASEYFRELICQDQKRKASERLEAMLLEGLESGNPTAMTEENWREIRQAVRFRVFPRIRGCRNKNDLDPKTSASYP